MQLLRCINDKTLLEDVMKNLKVKVIDAPQKLHLQLAGSAEQPAVAASSSDGVDAHDGFPVGEDPFLAELRRRQQKRATQSEAEEQRPFAKPKVHRFLTSAASSNLGRAEQSDTASSSAGRVEESSISLRSAEQPAISRLLKMSSIRDVQAWLNEGHVASCSSAEAQHIREAVA